MIPQLRKLNSVTFMPRLGYSIAMMTVMSAIMLLIPNFALVDAAAARRFHVIGPVVTITLKDPSTSGSSSSSTLSSSDGQEGSDSLKWGLNLNELKPNINWSIQSRSRPLPNWFPSLHSLRANLGYNYDENAKYIPSFIESEINFSPNLSSLYSPVSSSDTDDGDGPSSSSSTSTSLKMLNGMNLKLQPSYEFRTKRGQLLVQVSKGTSYIVSQFVTKGERWLNVIKGCYQNDSLPYATIGAIRVTSTYDFNMNQPICTLEATTGSQRTKATLNLQKSNPTLSIIHAYNDRYVLAVSHVGRFASNYVRPSVCLFCFVLFCLC